MQAITAPNPRELTHSALLWSNAARSLPPCHSFQTPPSPPHTYCTNPTHDAHPTQHTPSPACIANTTYTPNPTHTPNPSHTQTNAQTQLNTHPKPNAHPNQHTHSTQCAPRTQLHRQGQCPVLPLQQKRQPMFTAMCFSGKHEHLLPPRGVRATEAPGHTVTM